MFTPQICHLKPFSACTGVLIKLFIYFSLANSLTALCHTTRTEHKDTSFVAGTQQMGVQSHFYCVPCYSHKLFYKLKW